MRDTLNFDLALAQILHEYRKQRGLTRKELAALIDGSESHIKAIKTRKGKLTILAFVQIAQALAVQADKLLREVLQREAYLNDRNRTG